MPDRNKISIILKDIKISQYINIYTSISQYIIIERYVNTSIFKNHAIESSVLKYLPLSKVAQLPL